MNINQLATAFIAATLLPMSAQSAVIAVGNVTDALGDNTAPAPDLVSGYVAIDSGGSATFSATFAAGTSLTNASAFFNVDIDKNPATGYPGVDTANNNSSLMGTEYGIEIFGTAFQASGTLWGYSGGFWAVLASGIPVAYSGTTEEVSISLADLGGGNGSMNFDILSQQQYTTNTFSGVGDYMPDIGGYGSVTVPEPGTLALAAVGLACLARRRRR